MNGNGAIRAGTAAYETPALQVGGLIKRFGAVTALRGVDMHIGRAEVVGLVGDNGAGKSTLVSCIAGTLRPDEGSISVDGVEHSFQSASDARAAGIETVFQSLSLVPTLDIAANVFLGREAYRGNAVGRKLHWMDKRAMRTEVMRRLSELGLRLPHPTTKVAALSGGQRQAVAIARAVIWGSDIVLLDEPAAALGVQQTEIVLSFIERLKNHGVAVLFISHNMAQVLRVADRVVVMRLGRVVHDVATIATSGRELVEHITGAA
jgi:ABC-type sugar transport system ATPase subunit